MIGGYTENNPPQKYGGIRKRKDFFITDFSNPLFQAAFKEYFSELGVNVKDWDRLFREMKHWLFSESIGFIREFWVSAKFRGQGQGTGLLKLAENYFVENNICKAILTTDTTPEFYIKRGYIRDCSYQAKNEDEVFVKLLKQAE